MMLMNISLSILSLLNILTCTDIQLSGTQPGSAIETEKTEFESAALSISVEDILQGIWRVAYLDDDLNLTNLGILLIHGTEYQFTRFPAAITPSWYSSRFSFIRNLHGSVEFGYLPETGQTDLCVSARPDDNLNEFDNRAILVTCQFDNGEKFYIKLDLDEMELYFHGMLSEFQLYHIYKNI